MQRLNELLGKAVRSDEASKFYENTHTERVTSTPEKLAQFQAAESQKWGRIIKTAGIEAE